MKESERAIPISHNHNVVADLIVDITYECRNIGWLERLYLEESTGCGFDVAWSSSVGFTIDKSTSDAASRIRLTGMGPKLFISDISTADQPVLRWRLRVKGNTAAEFGVLPVALQPTQTALHKTAAVVEEPSHRCTGFCSQITAGSLLPLKFPILRGTVIDLMAQRGRLEAILQYPPDAKEIHWQNGQPVQKAYCGPSELRFQLDFSDDCDVRLAGTAWAKACYEILHATGHRSHTRHHGAEPGSVSAFNISDEGPSPMDISTPPQEPASPSLDQTHPVFHMASDRLPAIVRSESRMMLSTDGAEDIGSSSSKS